MNDDILENLNERLDEALDRGRQMVKDDELAEQINEFRVKTEALIRKHPLKSLGAGLLAGYIIGKIFSPDD